MILDASVIFKWYVKKDEADMVQADLILEKFVAGTENIKFPDLLIYEISNALFFCKQLSLQDKQLAIAKFFDLGIEIVPINKNNIIESITIAEKQNITIYDAIYLALAKNFNEPLITANPKHQKLSKNYKVIQLKDYS